MGKKEETYPEVMRATYVEHTIFSQAKKSSVQKSNYFLITELNFYLEL